MLNSILRGFHFDDNEAGANALAHLVLSGLKGATSSLLWSFESVGRSPPKPGELNLALGTTVIADCVNPLSVTREAWRAVAADASSALVEVEIVCSDPVEHRRRVESRKADVAGFTLPAWDDVLHREYEAWTTSRLVIDSARVSASKAASLILERSRSQAGGA